LAAENAEYGMQQHTLKIAVLSSSAVMQYDRFTAMLYSRLLFPGPPLFRTFGIALNLVTEKLTLILTVNPVLSVCLSLPSQDQLYRSNQKFELL